MRIRSRLKSEAAKALWRTGMDRAFGRLAGGGRGPVVVTYHRVVENFPESAKTSIPSMLMSVRSLERHLDWIGQRYRFVDLDELGKLMESHDGKSERAASVTFDDGYRDFFDLAVPLLRKKGIPAAVFVVTGLVGTREVPLHDRLYLVLARRHGRALRAVPQTVRLPNFSAMQPYEATRAMIETLPLSALRCVVETLEAEDHNACRLHEQFRTLDWDQLAAVRKFGFTVGSHTRSHVLLTKVNGAHLREELVTSRVLLEEKLSEPVRHFAYPSGFYNDRIVRAVAAAGYRYAYTTCTHRSAEHPLLTIPRTPLWENTCLDSERVFSPALLSCQIHRTFDLLAGCRQMHRANAEVAG